MLQDERMYFTVSGRPDEYGLEPCPMYFSKVCIPSEENCLLDSIILFYFTLFSNSIYT